MPNTTAARYRDADGVWHTLRVRHTAGGWQVIDLAGEQERVIETLTGVGDGRPQAEAIARDYLMTVGRSRQPAERAPGDATSEQGGRDAHSHRRPRAQLRRQPARGVALPDPAR